jgi:hypothetical protein
MNIRELFECLFPFSHAFFRGILQCPEVLFPSLQYVLNRLLLYFFHCVLYFLRKDFILKHFWFRFSDLVLFIAQTAQNFIVLGKSVNWAAQSLDEVCFGLLFSRVFDQLGILVRQFKHLCLELAILLFQMRDCLIWLGKLITQSWY